MPLPNRSVRIDPSHSDVLNSVLDMLRAGHADDLRSMLQELSVSPDRKSVGPFKNGQAALDFLVCRMVFAAHPISIWLFGSRARGEARQDSDFDLMAIFPDTDEPRIDELKAQLAASVIGAGVGCDVMACTLSEFEEFKATAGSMIRTVHEEGREVYVSRAARRGRPS